MRGTSRTGPRVAGSEAGKSKMLSCAAWRLPEVAAISALGLGWLRIASTGHLGEVDGRASVELAGMRISAVTDVSVGRAGAGSPIRWIS